MSSDSDSTRRLTSIRFSTEHLRGPDAFDAWHEHLRPIIDLEPHEDGSSSGHHTMDTWELGDLVFCRDQSPGGTYERTARRIRRSAFDHYYLYVLKRGMFWYVSDGAQNSGKVHEGAIGTVGLDSIVKASHGELRNMDGFSVFLPRDRVPNLTAALDAACGGRIAGPLGGILSDYLQLVERRLPDLTNAEAGGISRSVIELLSACFATEREPAEQVKDLILDVKKQRVCRFIQSQIMNPKLSVDFITRSCGVSRSSLYRIFDEDGGVAKYIERHRMRRVLDVIEDPFDNRNIAQIAAELGFSGASDLGRIFRRHFGHSPTETRKRKRDEVLGGAKSEPRSAINTALRNSYKYLSPKS